MEQEKKDGRQWILRIASWLWRRSVVTALAFGIMGLYAVVALNVKVFNPISKAFADYSITDFYYDMLATGTPDTSNIVTIVDMTELPNRRTLAMALEEIAECKPKAVGVDVVFEGLKEFDELGDRMIDDVAHAQPKTVFSYKLITDSWDGHEYHQTVRSFFADSLITQGYTNMPRNLYGGMKRQLSLGCYVEGELVPSLIKRVADEYAGEETMELADKNVRINFRPMEYKVVPPDSIMEYRELIEDRIVLFGAMTEEADMHYTPRGKIAGVKLLAYAIETLLKHNEIKEVPLWLTWVISFLVVLIAVVFLERYDRFVAKRSTLTKVVFGSILVKGLVRFAWIAIFMWLAFLLFSLFNISLNLAYAVTAIAFTVSANNLYDQLSKYFKEKKETKSLSI
jgi:CHASE2 domain-containing sensor protein